ncbi:PREDICTED: vesicle-associated membrane protein 3 [Corvus brachyrhynchos]|uniref:vesicle-associated membrane protein 3 n=1 Tax=Corvus brachyrhynchos TaxID=85066 RepID=UPI00081662B8|nr:PREDICTED: vesicle-associated membrane protein 3 [Corvus brachyrhynchos]
MFPGGVAPGLPRDSERGGPAGRPWIQGGDEDKESPGPPADTSDSTTKCTCLCVRVCAEALASIRECCSWCKELCYEFKAYQRSANVPGSSNMAAGGNRRLQQTQHQVDEVVDIMRVNVDKVLERDQKLSELDDRADALQAGASQFETSAAKLKRKYWWKNCKMWAILIAVVVIIIIIIIVWSVYS